MKNRSWIEQITIVSTLIVAFFAVADSPTFQTSVWKPLAAHTTVWSANDWKNLAGFIFCLLAGVWLIFLIKQGLRLGGLRSRLWLLGPALIILITVYRLAKLFKFV